MDKMDLYYAYEEIVKDIIEYDILCWEYPQDEIDGVVSIITDTVCTSKGIVVIGGEAIPAEVAKNRLLKNRFDHVKYVFDCMQKNPTNIRNIKQYMLTALYNAPVTIGLYYKAAVNRDMMVGGSINVGVAEKPQEKVETVAQIEEPAMEAETEGTGTEPMVDYSRDFSHAPCIRQQCKMVPYGFPYLELQCKRDVFIRIIAAICCGMLYLFSILGKSLLEYFCINFGIEIILSDGKQGFPHDEWLGDCGCVYHQYHQVEDFGDENAMSRFIYIFVHGLSGWGSYDTAYKRMPYWGMRGGDLITWLREQGFDCHAASVAPVGSAWDRACELYAQIAGSRVDYGKAHSGKYRHERFGRDYSAKPLIPEWKDDTKLVLLGHSFGGATIRLFSELLSHGDVEEIRAGSDSPFFAGGMEEHIHAIVTLASPMNGTTAYDLFSDESFDPSGVKVPWWSMGLADIMSLGTRPERDGRDPRDYADYDMHVDHAMEMNARISTLPSVFYFSVPCSFTKLDRDGNHHPEKGIEPLFAMRANQIGAYTGKTKGGVVIDGRWKENDGLVNTVSAMAPGGAPSKTYDGEDIQRGVWNVFPAVKGDHMWLQGGLVHRHNIRDYYKDLLTMIERL